MKPQAKNPQKPAYTVIDDPRMARKPYRDMMAGLVAQLTVGGGWHYIKDGHGRITGRSPSLNPDWFKDMDTAYKPSVRGAGEWVQRALDFYAQEKEGKRFAKPIPPLGSRQESFVSALLDVAQDERRDTVE